MSKARGVLEDGSLAVGDRAPDFELPALIAGVRKTFRLSTCLGRKVALLFYPFNWEDASIRQIAAWQMQRERVLAVDSEIVGVTVESIMNTTAWERANGPIDFPLCSDFWPHGEVSARYSVLRQSGPGAGACERAVVVVGRDGRIVFQRIYRPDEIPPQEEILSLLEK